MNKPGCRSQQARVVRRAVARAEAQGKRGYAICLRCGRGFDGEWCPQCDR